MHGHVTVQHCNVVRCATNDAHGCSNYAELVCEHAKWLV